MIVYLARAIQAFVMYCVNGTSRSSLLIESTDSMITAYLIKYRINTQLCACTLHITQCDNNNNNNNNDNNNNNNNDNNYYYNYFSV